MKSTQTFLRRNRSLLLFGFLLTFFSCFGQTIIISLYVPELGSVFDLNNTELSSLYAAATLGSAFLLPWVGRYLDIWRLDYYTIGTILVLGVALVTLSLAGGVITILLGFWGLRLGGQGLMSHTAASTMVRAFEVNRGKAISIASLGYPASEAVMPLLMAFVIVAVGWRSALQLSAFFVLLLVLPLTLWLLKGTSATVRQPAPVSKKADVETAKTVRNPWRLLKGRLFWILLPSLFLLAFLNTAIFFFQLKLGESRGWEPGWVAGSVAAFAVASASGMMLAGPVVDRLSARMVFPFFMLPYVLGLVLLALFEAPLIYPVSLFLLGMSNGASSPVKNAVLAELYGAGIIGSVRSMVTMVIVFSTALGPVTFGILRDSGMSYTVILLIAALAVLLSMGWSLLLFHRITRRRWAVYLRGNSR